MELDVFAEGVGAEDSLGDETLADGAAEAVVGVDAVEVGVDPLE